ncbi:MAG: hypothetical protein HY597_06580 [Candidatus Omnitrophica bacterium]|nr:hypothetical protein [Candidatus Omnitrophota bacterium]
MDHEAFRQSLLHMLEDGTFQEIVGVEGDQCGQVEFRLQRIYHVHLTKKTVEVHEWEAELVRQQVNGRWRDFPPMIRHRQKLVLDRPTGAVLQISGVDPDGQTPRPTKSVKPRGRALLAVV